METETLQFTEQVSDTLQLSVVAGYLFHPLIEHLFEADGIVHNITATALRWSRWPKTRNVWFNESNLFRQVGATPFDNETGVWGASFQGLQSVDDSLARLEGTMRGLLDFMILDLRGSDVTDRGLKRLLKAGLKILYLQGTAVTEFGRNELASALPSLHLEWETDQNRQCVRRGRPL
jgi:hypothetical protein